LCSYFQKSFGFEPSVAVIPDVYEVRVPPLRPPGMDTDYGDKGNCGFKDVSESIVAGACIILF
jgi:hypothetical protein